MDTLYTGGIEDSLSSFSLSLPVFISRLSLAFLSLFLYTSRTVSVKADLSYMDKTVKQRTINWMAVELYRVFPPVLGFSLYTSLIDQSLHGQLVPHQT